MHILQLQAWQDEEAAAATSRRALQIHYAGYMLSGDTFLHAPMGHIRSHRNLEFSISISIWLSVSDIQASTVFLVREQMDKPFVTWRPFAD